MCWEWNLFYKAKSQSHVRRRSGRDDAYPEVPAACQPCEAYDLVVRLTKPSDLPAAQVVDRRERVRCSDAERHGDSGLLDTIGCRLARGGLGSVRVVRINALRA